MGGGGFAQPWLTVSSDRRRHRGAALGSIAVTVVLAGVLVVDPAGHLAHGRTGWLS